MIIYTRILRPLRLRGIALYPFILLKEKPTDTGMIVTLNHERIHIRQQEECLVLCLPFIAWLAFSVSQWMWLWCLVNPFYLWYITEYLVYRVRYRNHSQAYFSISFEKEAYDNQYDETYLKYRHSFTWLNYL